MVSINPNYDIPEETEANYKIPAFDGILKKKEQELFEITNDEDLNLDDRQVKKNENSTC